MIRLWWKTSSLIIVIRSISLSWFSYAQESCAACDDAPADLQEYFALMDELIQLLPTNENTDARQATGATTALSKIKQWANIQEVIMTEILTPGKDYDLYADIEMVYGEESRQRDWKKLLNTHIAIINRTVAMVNAKQHIVPIPDDVAIKIDALMKEKLKYMRLKKDSEGKLVLSHDGIATYKTLAQILRHIQLMYQDLHEEKWFDAKLYQVGQGYYKTNDQDIEKAISKAEDDVLKSAIHEILAIKNMHLAFDTKDPSSVDILKYIEFTDNNNDFIVYVWQVASEYGCSLWLARNMCLTKWQEVREDISYLFKERLVSDTERALNTFKSSWWRLKGALGKGSTEDINAAKQREESLLNSYRWSEYPSKDAFWKVVNVSSTIEPHPIRVETLWKTVASWRKKQSNDISWDKAAPKKVLFSENLDTVSQSSTQPDRNSYTDKDAKKQKLIESAVVVEVLQEAAENYRFVWGFNKDTLSDRKEASMRATFLSVLDLQKKLRTESVFNDVNRTTKRFPLLSAAVHANMQLLWKKNPTSEAEWGWYYAMSQTCELQCQNIDGKTCQHFSD